MTGQEDRTEIELELGTVRLRVSGTEEFVKKVLSEPENWIVDAMRVLAEIETPPARGEADRKRKAEGGEPPPTPADWRSKIAADSDISTDSVDDIFQYEDNWISVKDWPTEGDEEERFQELALLVMYANRVLTGESDFSTRKVTRALRDLGLEYDSRSIGEQLANHAGIISPKSRWLRIKANGRKEAKRLLKEREKVLEGS